MVTPDAKRKAVAHACTVHAVSQRRACLALTMTLWPWGAALAQGPTPRVYTRAVVRELPAVGAQPALLRLKIVPLGKLPFSTLTFRVQDRRLLNGIGDRKSVV